MRQKVVFAEMWRGGQLLVEERWEDSKDGGQTTRYAFPGGKMEDDETPAEAMSRESYEEVGVAIAAENWGTPQEIKTRKFLGYGFKILLPGDIEIKDGIIALELRDIHDYLNRRKLLPLTQRYVERNLADA